MSKALDKAPRLDKDRTSDFKQASVANRMSGMASRATTLVEDIAYGMLGLLNINMTIDYGQSLKVFMRLRRTLMQD